MRLGVTTCVGRGRCPGEKNKSQGETHKDTEEEAFYKETDEKTSMKKQNTAAYTKYLPSNHPT